MIIKKIFFQNSSKEFTISTDEDVQFTISEDAFVKFNLYKNKEIDSCEIESILYENEKYNSINLSLKFLSNRKTQKEVFLYLKNLNIREDIIENTINYLKELNYINDYEYALAFSNDKLKINKYGPLKIKNLLTLKGIDSDIISKVFSNLPSDLIYKNISEACEKKILSLQGKDKIFEKTTRHLINKGYDYEQIKLIIKEYL